MCMGLEFFLKLISFQSLNTSRFSVKQNKIIIIIIIIIINRKGKVCITCL